MRAVRWRVRTLLGLVAVVALGLGVAVSGQDPAQRVGEIHRLAELRPPPAHVEPALVDALGDRDEGVRKAALAALVRIGSTSPALVRALIEALEAETEEPRHWWPVDPVRALERIRPPAATVAPLLRKAMASPAPSVRLRATRVLCEAVAWPGPPGPDLAPLLLAALGDREPVVRRIVPEALARLDTATRRKAVAILMDQLLGPGRPSQLLAATGLAHFGDEARPAVAILAERLRAGGAAARAPEPPAPAGPARPGPPKIEIRQAKMPMPGEEVDGPLAARLLDLYLLGRLGPAARPAVPEVVRAMTARDAEQHVPFVLNAFLPRLGAPNWVVFERDVDSGDRSQLSSLRPTGAAVLGRIGPEARAEAVEILLGMIRGGDKSEKVAAAEALAALGAKPAEAFPPLLALAERDDPDPAGGRDWLETRRGIGALARVCADDDPRLIDALIRLLKSRDPEKRSAAAATLNGLRPPPVAAVPALIAGLKDKDEVQSVRFHAAETLGRYDGPEGEAAVPVLLDALCDKDGGVRNRAAKSLARRRAAADRVVPAAIGLLRSEHSTYQQWAAEVLEAYGPAASAAIPALREARHAEASFVREAAEKALKAIAPTEAPEPVEGPRR